MFIRLQLAAEFNNNKNDNNKITITKKMEHEEKTQTEIETKFFAPADTLHLGLNFSFHAIFLRDTCANWMRIFK